MVGGWGGGWTKQVPRRKKGDGAGVDEIGLVVEQFSATIVFSDIMHHLCKLFHKYCGFSSPVQINYTPLNIGAIPQIFDAYPPKTPSLVERRLSWL